MIIIDYGSFINLHRQRKDQDRLESGEDELEILNSVIPPRYCIREEEGLAIMEYKETGMQYECGQSARSVLCDISEGYLVRFEPIEDRQQGFGK